jgi:hypothetical protein
MGVYAQDINPSGQLGNPVIPVELISFTGFNNDGILTLNWTTATETNNAGFEIEKMKTSWQKIVFIPGAGTTTETRSYSFTDEEVSYGIIQYRLKQIDYDGSFEYSNIVEVEEGVPEKFSLKQNYPNPFNPSATISYSISELSFVTLKVYDVLGNEIKTLVNEEKVVGNYEVEFNATRLPSGIYFYQLSAGSFIQTKKMIMLK